MYVDLTHKNILLQNVLWFTNIRLDCSLFGYKTIYCDRLLTITFESFEISRWDSPWSWCPPSCCWLLWPRRLGADSAEGGAGRGTLPTPIEDQESWLSYWGNSVSDNFFRAIWCLVSLSLTSYFVCQPSLVSHLVIVKHSTLATFWFPFIEHIKSG